MSKKPTALQRTLVVYRHTQLRTDNYFLQKKHEEIFGFKDENIYKRSSELLKLGYVEKQRGLGKSFYKITLSGDRCDIHSVSNSPKYIPYKPSFTRKLMDYILRFYS